MNLSRLGWRAILLIATTSMLLQQAFSYACHVAVPILADRIAQDFGISRAWLGLYLFIQSFASILAAVGCGGFIARYGPLRVAQVATALMATSLLVTASGWLWLYPLGAFLLGAISASTPASSTILARVCPPRIAPLMFSVKQTGVPLGALIGGLMIPALLGLVFYSALAGRTIRLGPYGAALVMALVVYLVALALQPLRAQFDADRDPRRALALSDVPETIRSVVEAFALRDIAFAAFALGGLQSLFAGFFVLYLVDGLGYTEARAGTVFAIGSFSAIWARILWGLVGGSLATPRLVLSMLGLASAVATVLMASADHTWTFRQLCAVAILYNATAVSWHGVLLAETARLAPPGKVGSVTGGVLAFTSIAMMLYPAFYGIILASTGSYRLGFLLGAIPAFLAFVILLGRPIRGRWSTFLLEAAHPLLAARTLLTLLAVLAAGTALGLAALWVRVW
jgi:MFS family permease